MTSFILASKSPRRIDLLQQAGMVPEKVVPADIDESVNTSELPRQYVKRVAKDKAIHVAKQFPNTIILSADTIVTCGKRILLKAKTDEEVVKCLTLLSGKTHTVMTAICAYKPRDNYSLKVIETKVKFKRLSKNQIAHYVASKEGLNIAGGYAIQGLAETFVKRINGSYSGVVGLPLYETKNLLMGVGVCCE